MDMRSVTGAVAMVAITAFSVFAQSEKKPAAGKPVAGKPVVAAVAKPKLDTAKLEDYLRHLNLWTNDIKVEIREPKPAAILPGFFDVEVKASLGERFIEQKYLVNADATRVVKGDVYDTSANPFVKELETISNVGSPGLGTTGAPVVVSLFTDFQCPYCKEAAKMIRANLIQSYPKQVKLYLHDFPLEQIHPWARVAAVAGRCAALQGEDQFWRFHDWAFDRQGNLTPETFKSEVGKWAPLNGIESLAFNRCIENKETDAEVAKDVAMAVKLGLNSTPTMFVNGRKLAGNLPWESMKRVIDLEIAYQEKHHNAGDTACCSVTLSVPGAKE